LDEIEDEIQLKPIKISKELAIKNKKNNKDQDSRETVPQEYHHLLDVFGKRERRRVYPPTDRISNYESTWKKE